MCSVPTVADFLSGTKHLVKGVQEGRGNIVSKINTKNVHAIIRNLDFVYQAFVEPESVTVLGGPNGKASETVGLFETSHTIHVP